MMVRITATRMPGAVGRQIFRPTMMPSANRPIPSAQPLVWSRLARNSLTSTTMLPPSVLKPKSLGNWLTMMITARPAM